MVTLSLSIVKHSHFSIVNGGKSSLSGEKKLLSVGCSQPLPTSVGRTLLLMHINTWYIQCSGPHFNKANPKPQLFSDLKIRPLMYEAPEVI